MDKWVNVTDGLPTDGLFRRVKNIANIVNWARYSTVDRVWRNISEREVTGVTAYSAEPGNIPLSVPIEKKTVTPYVLTSSEEEENKDVLFAVEFLMLSARNLLKKELKEIKRVSGHGQTYAIFNEMTDEQVVMLEKLQFEVRKIMVQVDPGTWPPGKPIPFEYHVVWQDINLL